MRAQSRRDLDWDAVAKSAGFQIAEMANRAGTSVRTLERKFVRKLGVTPNQWLKQVRLRKAESLLKAGVRVKDVAWKLGYRHPSNFSRAFGRDTGHQPNSAKKKRLGCG